MAALCKTTEYVLILLAITSLSGENGYVEPSLCANCHRDIAETYSKTGMGRSFSSVRPETALEEFDGKTFHHEVSEEYFTPYRKAGKPYLQRHQTGFDGSIVNVLDSQVDYVFGSGNHARSYMHRAPNGKLIELPLTWYAEKGGYWGMSPAYDRPDHLGFSRAVNYRCLFCHNGYPDIERGGYSVAGSAFPSRLPQGIDCQRCHGPGSQHVRAAQNGATLDQVRASSMLLHSMVRGSTPRA